MGFMIPQAVEKSYQSKYAFISGVWQAITDIQVEHTNKFLSLLLDHIIVKQQKVEVSWEMYGKGAVYLGKYISRCRLQKTLFSWQITYSLYPEILLPAYVFSEWIEISLGREGNICMREIIPLGIQYLFSLSLRFKSA